MRLFDDMVRLDAMMTMSMYVRYATDTSIMGLRFALRLTPTPCGCGWSREVRQSHEAVGRRQASDALSHRRRLVGDQLDLLNDLRHRLDRSQRVLRSLHLRAGIDLQSAVGLCADLPAVRAGPPRGRDERGNRKTRRSGR